MASDKHRSGKARVARLKTRADILWAAGSFGIMVWGLTFWLGQWVLLKTVGSELAMAVIATVAAGGIAFAVAYLATRGKGGLGMLLVPTPTAV